MMIDEFPKTSSLFDTRQRWEYGGERSRAWWILSKLTTSYLSSGCPGCLSKSGALRSNIRSDGALPLPRAFRSRVKLFTEFWVTHAYPN